MRHVVLFSLFMCLLLVHVLTMFYGWFNDMLRGTAVKIKSLDIIVLPFACIFRSWKLWEILWTLGILSSNMEYLYTNNKLHWQRVPKSKQTSKTYLTFHTHLCI